MGRRLPVYVLLDVSTSMTAKISAVENGLQTLVDALLNEPNTVEMAYVSVVTFSDEATQIVPLTDLSQFTPPSLSVGGRTAIGKALRYVTECAQNEVVKSTAGQKGDYRPLLFIMTDGLPTDPDEERAEAISTLKAYKWGKVVGCGACSKQVERDRVASFLKNVTDNVFALDTSDVTSFAKFFEFVSSSIIIESKRISGDDNDSDFPDLPSEMISLSK